MAAGKIYLVSKTSKKATKKRRKRLYIPKGIPNKQKIKFTYSEQFTINSGINTAANHVFSANGMYDPDITGTGHQPLLFDQYVATLYNHYTVIGSKITCYFANTDTVHGQICGVRLSDSVTALTNPTQLLEQGRSSYKLYAPIAAGGGTAPCTLKVAPPKFLASAKGSLSNDQLRGNSAANPSEQCYFHVFGMCDDSASDAGGINVTVVIEYLAMLTEPNKDLTQS